MSLICSLVKQVIPESLPKEDTITSPCKTSSKGVQTGVQNSIHPIEHRDDEDVYENAPFIRSDISALQYTPKRDRPPEPSPEISAWIEQKPIRHNHLCTICLSQPSYSNISNI